MPDPHSPAAFDVFVTYADEDFAVAGQLVDTIEARGFTCWIARRDILPRDSYEAAIVRAIRSSRVMVVVWSQAAGQSRHVQREVRTASEHGLTMLRLRIDETPMSEVFLYHLGGSQWFDAIHPPRVDELNRLADALGRVLAEPASAAHAGHATSGDPDEAARAAANGDPKHESVIVTATVPYRDVERFTLAIRRRLPVALASHSGGESKEYTDLSLRFRMPIAAGIVTAAVQKAAAELGGQVIAITDNPQPPGVLSISGTVDLDALRRAPAKSPPDAFRYEGYWKAFRAALAQSGSRLRPPTPRAKNWVRFPTGGGGARIHAFASTRGRYIGVELALDRAEHAATFGRLQAERPQIEREIGEALEWNEHEASYRIALTHTGLDPANAADWPRQHAWFTEKLNAFYAALVTRLDAAPAPVAKGPGSAEGAGPDPGEAGAKEERRASAPWDVFISHAHEDKEAVARPLATELRSRGIRVWYDEFTLSLGDSLGRSIDRGLAESRFGVVVLSPSFFAKEWPMRELSGLTSRERAGGKVILPLWHGVQQSDVARYSPQLADRLAITTELGIAALADAIIAVITQ